MGLIGSGVEKSMRGRNRGVNAGMSWLARRKRPDRGVEPSESVTNGTRSMLGVRLARMNRVTLPYS